MWSYSESIQILSLKVLLNSSVKLFSLLYAVSSGLLSVVDYAPEIDLAKFGYYVYAFGQGLISEEKFESSIKSNKGKCKYRIKLTLDNLVSWNLRECVLEKWECIRSNRAKSKYDYCIYYAFLHKDQQWDIEDILIEWQWVEENEREDGPNAFTRRCSRNIVNREIELHEIIDSLTNIFNLAELFSDYANEFNLIELFNEEFNFFNYV